jgi:predicted ester cyclase
MIEEVMNGGRLDVIEEFYPPQMAPGARRWIAPSRESFSDVHMDIVDLITEGDQVVGRFRRSRTNLGSWHRSGLRGDRSAPRLGQGKPC